MRSDFKISCYKMFNWVVSIISALVMLVMEYIILIPVYQKLSRKDWKVLIIPPILLILSQYLTYWIQDKGNEERQLINPFILVIVFLTLKLPFSIYRHDIVPGLSLGERMVISGAEAITATLIAEGIVFLFKRK